MLGMDFYGAVAAATVAWIILIYVVVTRSSRSSRSWSIPRPHRLYRVPSQGDGTDYALNHVERQLRAVMTSSFEKRRLLNSGEYRTFKTIEDYVAGSRGGYRVFAQTSLGEILASPDENAFRSINSKRVDILIVDQGWPVLAIEYQGGAHYQGTAAIRDAVKKEALGKAGIGYVEVFASDTPDEIRLLIRERLGWAPQTSSREATQERTH